MARDIRMRGLEFCRADGLSGRSNGVDIVWSGRGLRGRRCRRLRGEFAEAPSGELGRKLSFRKSTIVASVVREALSLSSDERADVVGELLASLASSLHDDAVTVRDDWASELEVRARRADSARAFSMPTRVSSRRLRSGRMRVASSMMCRKNWMCVEFPSANSPTTLPVS